MKHLLGELKKLGHVEAVYLFGSQAKGGAKPYSDIDICVLTEPKITAKTKSSILSNSSRNIDISLFWDLPPAIRMRVIKEGKLLFERDELLTHRAKVKTIYDYQDFKPILDRHCARILS